jgi:hypothetical protein
VNDLLTSVLTALLAALAASSLTLQRVKRERRWEAKHQAYRSILRALHDIHFWAEEAYADLSMLPTVGAEKRDALRRRVDEAKHELWGFVHVGKLDISSDCAGVLESLLESVAIEEHRFREEVTDFDDDDPAGAHEYQEDLRQHYDKIRALIKTEIPAIVGAAKKDLT